MITNQSKILLAEDDFSLALMMKDTLEEEGYKVEYCRDGKEAIEKFNKNQIDMCLLDIMMPQKDGFAVAKKIRQQSDVIPILFLSTKGELQERLKGYETGADDYISKPFSMQELLMKIEVFLRRSKKIHSEVIQDYILGNIRFSYTELKIYTDKESIELTNKESELLKFFCEHSNCVLKREEVLLEVWGKDDFFLGRSMDVYISKLRKYLKHDPLIKLETIHNVGYRFIIPGKQSDELD